MVDDDGPPTEAEALEVLTALGIDFARAAEVPDLWRGSVGMIRADRRDDLLGVLADVRVFRSSHDFFLVVADDASEDKLVAVASSTIQMIAAERSMGIADSEWVAMPDGTRVIFVMRD